MSITEFLEARIAEDEALAHAVIATVTPDAWENPTKWGNFYPEDIAFWDSQTPNRVLAECAAKRAIIKAFDPQFPDLDPYVGRDVIAMLAVVYSDHPDYQQEWAL